MKQIPKYEYFMLITERHSYYSKEMVQELNNQIATMVAEGWQTEGEHQWHVKAGYSEMLLTQMMKRLHPEYIKAAEEEHRLMYTDDQIANLPIVVE